MGRNDLYQVVPRPWMRASTVSATWLTSLQSVADADYLPGADADGNERLTPAHRNIRGKEYFAAIIKQSTNNDNEQNGNKR